MARQVSGYKNWKATITPQVRQWKELLAGPAGSCGQQACSQAAACAPKETLSKQQGLQGGNCHATGCVLSLCRSHPCRLTPKMPQPYIEHFADCKDKLVYLTADSESELQEVSCKS